MAALNRDAAEQMIRFDAHACTDITGFSFLGHLSEMTTASGVSARIDTERVPLFAEALGCAKGEIIPGAVERNRESFSEGITTIGREDVALLSVLYDAQTSGGLLVALPENQAEAYVETMQGLGHDATSIIGEICQKQQWQIQVALNEPGNLSGTYREPRKTSQSTETSCCEEPHKILSCCENPPGEIPCGDSIPVPGIKEETMSSNVSQAAESFSTFMKTAGEPGLLDAKTKKLVAIALSISQRCEPCLTHHLKAAWQQGIPQAEIDEVAWVAISFTGCTGKMFYQEVLQKVKSE